MGCDTQGRLKGRVEVEEICKALKDIGCNKISYEKEDFKKYYVEKVDNLKEQYDEKCYYIGGFINFTKDDKYRTIHYFYQSYNYYENQEWYDKIGLSEMYKCEHTDISLGMDEQAIKVIGELVKRFGGWIHENDCGEKDPYLIPKQE